MSERSERTSKHGPYDGGACGAVSAHWCRATSHPCALTHDGVGHQ
jgi:hypothetical protein